MPSIELAPPSIAVPVAPASSPVIAVGTASFYSEECCRERNPSLLMANGEKLDDDKFTVALPPNLFRQYRNKFVVIANRHTGRKVTAKVTDTGSFHLPKYGHGERVADVTPAVRDAIGLKTDEHQITILLASTNF
jgi:rare lipoprotein A (peptidoglycan hydrolase)